ncbi:Peptidase A1 [Penicillium griseofulvum]|uniref:penicillopepsin n=1 Tax=Penicillium patulum TaxID=5078 RepID=A0A135LU94_PENPA|nr:Peptidase A1 [Penicillium griseofulvum]KXG52530.1 Peptidase A1 [Penicillium griseofulvum]
MQLSSCLVFIAGISGVHAFYPWELRVGASVEAPVERRFIPWTLIEATSDETTDTSSTADTKTWTLDLKKMPVRRDDGYKIVESHKPSLPNSAPLNQDGTDYSYFSPVYVGSEKKEMWMAIDTGAPNTWVYDSSCNMDVCERHHKFDKSSSTSYTTDGSTFSLYYGSGRVDGKMGKDTISIAGLEVTQTFGQANNISENFQSYPFDGILGLGRSHTEGWNLPSFMDLVADKKLIKSNLVGFSLSRSVDGGKDGEINFGGVDTTKFDGTISYTATKGKTWSIPLDDAYVNGKSCNFSGKSATIDTGTTYLMIPPSDAETLFSLVPDSSKLPDSPHQPADDQDNYLIPCNSTSTIEFEFSGVKYNVSPKDYVGKPNGTNSDYCVSTIVGYASNGATWLVGDVFLKNVYTVFDFDNAKVGFGALASASASASKSNSSSTSSSTGNGTFTPPPVTATTKSAPDATSSSSIHSAMATISDSSASHLVRGISWSILPIILAAFAI